MFKKRMSLFLATLLMVGLPIQAAHATVALEQINDVEDIETLTTEEIEQYDADVPDAAEDMVSTGVAEEEVLPEDGTEESPSEADAEEAKVEEEPASEESEEKELSRTDVIQCDSLQDYVIEVSEMNAVDDHMLQTLEVNVATDVVTDTSGQEIEIYDDTIQEIMDDTESGYAAADQLETQSYEVLEQNSQSVTVSDPYQTKRIILQGGAFDGWSLADYAVHYGDEYILQYSEEADVISDLERFRDSGQFTTVMEDAVLFVDDQSLDEAVLPASIASGAEDSYYSWGVKAMGLDSLQETIEVSTYRENQVIVAVIDTGVDMRNPELASRIWVEGGYDVAENDRDFTPDAQMLTVMGWHGTTVASVIADGTSSNVRILPVKAYKAKVSSTGTVALTGTLSMVQAACAYLIDKDVDVVNISLGYTATTEEKLRNAEELINPYVDILVGSGVVYCAASGNHGSGVENVVPGHNPNVLSIGSVRQSDMEYSRSSFSNWGPDLDFVAPGEDIKVIYPGESSYTIQNGTSFASPHMAAACALLKSLKPDATAGEIKETLKRYSLDLGDEGWDSYYGYGMPVLTELAQQVTEEQDIEMIDHSFSGLQVRDGSLCYMEQGIQKTDFTGLYKYNNIWWYIQNGIVDSTYTGLCRFNDQWFYVDNGQWDRDYTGMCIYHDKWVYVKNGKFRSDFSGKVVLHGYTWNIVKGKSS